MLETRVVQLTVTEGGYNISPVTGESDLTNPQVAADLATDAAPQTMFGFVREALRRRRNRGLGAFTVMSCDNIQDNRAVAERAFTTYARAKYPELADWIRNNPRRHRRRSNHVAIRPVQRRRMVVRLANNARRPPEPDRTRHEGVRYA